MYCTKVVVGIGEVNLANGKLIGNDSDVIIWHSFGDPNSRGTRVVRRDMEHPTHRESKNISKKREKARRKGRKR